MDFLLLLIGLSTGLHAVGTTRSRSCYQATSQALLSPSVQVVPPRSAHQSSSKALKPLVLHPLHRRRKKEYVSKSSVEAENSVGSGGVGGTSWVMELDIGREKVLHIFCCRFFRSHRVSRLRDS